MQFEINELEDERLAPYRNVRDRDLLRERLFLAESRVVLEVLLKRSKLQLQSILVAKPRLERLAPLLRLAPPQLPVMVAPQQVLDEVTGFHIHRGVLAAGLRTEPPAPRELLDSLGRDQLRVVVLESLTNHDNVGGVFRNAAAFGADAVLLNKATCDPLYRKAIRVSVGGCLVVPYARYQGSLSLVEELRRYGFENWALTPASDSVTLASLRGRQPDRVALWLGTEGEGLSQGVIKACDRAVRIEIVSDFDSLNVAAASAVALHELKQVGHKTS
jgi:tRNA G18 (ribose-2'-O)-methylase SpoU